MKINGENIGDKIGKEVKGLQSEINSRRGTSLARMSSDATLQFPIIISRSINIDNAQTNILSIKNIFITLILPLSILENIK